MNDSQTSLSNDLSMKRFWQKVDAEYAAMQRVQDVYEGLTEGMGMSPAKAIKLLKTENARAKGTMTSKDFALLVHGDVPTSLEEWAEKNSRLIVKGSLEGKQKIAEEQMTDEEKKEAKRKREAWLATLKAAGIHVVTED